MEPPAALFRRFGRITGRSLPLPAGPSGRVLFRGGLELVVEEDEILLVERLVAVEAGREIGRGVGALVRLEGLVLPFAVADVVRVLGAPARALFHHRIADEIALDEAAVGVLLG